MYTPGGGAVGSAVLALDEGKHGDPFERGPSLTAADDHLDGGQRPGRRLGVVGLLARDPRPLQELVHDVHVGAGAGQLLHEVLQHHVHQPLFPVRHGIDRDVPKVDGVGAHPEIVLDFSQDDLFAGPPVVDDALEPGMLHHWHLICIFPQLVDEWIR